MKTKGMAIVGVPYHHTQWRTQTVPGDLDSSNKIHKGCQMDQYEDLFFTLSTPRVNGTQAHT